MRILLLIVALLALVLETDAQGYFWQSTAKKRHYKYLTVDGGPGLRMYYGDVQQPGALFNKVKVAYGLGVRYQWRTRVGFAAQFGGRGYAGKREHGGFPDAIDEMTGSLWEGQLHINYSWLKWEDFTQRHFTERDPVTKINAYVGTGFGGSQFTASYTSRTYQVATAQDSLGNDSIYTYPVDNSGSSAGVGIFVPVVFGMRYRFTPAWSLGAEWQYHFYISKNLDALATNKYDGMATVMVRLGYSFGQTKRKGNMKIKRR